MVKEGYIDSTLFAYSTEHLLSKDKVRFFYALKGRGKQEGIVKSTNSEHLGRTILLVADERAGEVEQFLSSWKCRFTKRRMMVCA